jgi:aspartate carbamoyltransferase catalytic subunit
VKHLFTIHDVSGEEVFEFIRLAQSFKQGDSWTPTYPTFAFNLFFEPSTRTKCSFEMAQRKLGLQVIPFDVLSSSVQKGESLYDTVKTLESIGANLVVIRHPQDEYFAELKEINIPIINGGDGCGHHPTQSLLDLMTIYEEFGTFEAIKVAIIGDIRHSRVARSNATILKKLGSEVAFAGPDEWFSDDYLQNGMYLTVDEATEWADVVMLLRIQHERHVSTSHLKTAQYHQLYGLTEERAKKMKPQSIIMHPAPVNRNVELASSLVESERSRIFQQMTNGVFMRMAIIKYLLDT